METDKYSGEECIGKLSRKRDLQIRGNTLYVLRHESKRAIGDIGNKSWGTIDFLVKKCRFTLQRLDDFKSIKNFG